jgi:hypothetical protein
MVNFQKPCYPRTKKLQAFHFSHVQFEKNLRNWTSSSQLVKYHQCATINQAHSSIDKARHIRTRPGWQGEQLLVEQTIYPTINDVTVSNILQL